MIDAKEREILVKGMKTLWIIWGAMFVSLGIYMKAAPMLVNEMRMQELPPDVYFLLRNVLYVVALIELSIIPFIKRMTLKSAKVSQNPNQNVPGTSNHPALAKYATAMITSLAIAESIAIYGLVLYLIQKDSSSLYLLSAISAMAMLIHRPKIEELEQLALAIRGNK